MADPLFYPGARLPEVRPLTDADIAAMGGQPVLPPQTPRSAVPPFEVVEFIPDAPAPEPAPAKKGDLLGEAKKGAIVGARGAQQMGVALGALANSNVVKASRDSLAAFDRIDRGETLPKPVQGRETLVDLNVENYQQATPAQRAELRAQVLGALTQSKENVEAATAAWREYQAKIQAEQGRVPNLTDVRDARDFGDWLAFSVGQGSVWMVPMMLTALVGGTPALAVAGLTMGAGDLASNTMERAIGPGTNLGGAQAEKYVTPQAAQRVGEALSSEANTIGALSLPYAAAEAVFGPAARVASGAMRETARQAAGQGIKGIAKTAGKEAALGGAEEFGAETTQEFLLSVADRLSPEQTPLLTRENALRWLNAGAAGGASGFAFGGVGGAAGAAVARPKGITERAADAATESGQPTPAQVILQQQARLQAPASMAAQRLPFEQEAQPIPGTGGWLPAAPQPLAGPDNVPRLPAPAPRLEFMTPTQVPPPAPPVPPAVDVVAGSFIADAQGGVSRETRGEQQAAAAARQRAADLGETPLRVPADRPPTRAEQAARPAPEGVSGLNERARAALIEAGRLRAEADRLRAIGTPQALATAEKTQARAQQFEQRATEQTRAAASEAGRVHSPDKAGSTPAPATPTQEADALARAREPEVRGALERLAEQVGWAQRGGRLIREDGEDQTSPVTGRTTWVPHADWYPTLPAEARISDPAVARRAVQKAAAGEKMTAKERRFVEALLAVHDEQQAAPEPSAPVLSEEDRQAFEQARAELAQPDEEAQAERAAIMAEAEDALADAGDFDGETLVTHTGADALRALGFTEDEITDAQTPDARAEGRTTESRALDGETDAAGTPTGRRAGEGATAAEESPGAVDDLFGGTGETAAQRAVREERARRVAEQRQQQQAAPDAREFTLTGSDRVADEAAARGQLELREPERSNTETPNPGDIVQVVGGTHNGAIVELLGRSVVMPSAWSVKIGGLPVTVRDVRLHRRVATDAARAGAASTTTPSGAESGGKAEGPTLTIEEAERVFETPVYRAGVGPDGDHWAYSPDAALAYKYNPPFGGDTIFVADASNLRVVDAGKVLVEVFGQEDYLSTYETKAWALESDEVRAWLRESDYDAVSYEDDFPNGASVLFVPSGLRGQEVSVDEAEGISRALSALSVWGEGNSVRDAARRWIDANFDVYSNEYGEFERVDASALDSDWLEGALDGKTEFRDRFGTKFQLRPKAQVDAAAPPRPATPEAQQPARIEQSGAQGVAQRDRGGSPLDGAAREPGPDLAAEERGVYAVTEPDAVSGDRYDNVVQAALSDEARGAATGVREPSTENGDVQPAAALSVRPAPGVPGLYRVTTQLVAVGERRLPRARVRSLIDAATIFAYLSDYAVEHYDALVTDADGVPLALIGNFKGATSQVSVPLATIMGELSRIDGAAHLWTAHNHPTGTPDLSNADVQLSQQIANALDGSGVEYHGLMALARGADGDVRFTSEQSPRPVAVPTDLPAAARVPIVERVIAQRDPGERVTTPDIARRLVPSVARAQPGVVFLDIQHRVTAFVPFAPQDMSPLRRDGRLMRLFRAASESGAAAALVAMPDGQVTPEQFRNLRNALSVVDVNVLDGVRYDSATGQARATVAETHGLGPAEAAFEDRTDSDADFARDVLSELAAADEAFRFPVSTAQSLSDVIRDVLPDHTYEGDATRPDEHQESGAERRSLFRTQDGTDYYVYERGRNVWIDVSRLQEGEGGSGVYAAVLNWAYNTGRTLIGDPAGLAEAAIVRRTWAMLASALRFGTTRHMEAAAEQRAGVPERGIAPLAWRGDDATKTSALIESALATLTAQNPDVSQFRFDFKRGEFVDAAGNTVDRGRFVAGAERGTARAARSGEATLRAGILIRSLVSSESGARPRILEAFLRGSRALTQGPLRGLFDRTPSGEGAIEAIDAVLPPAVQPAYVATPKQLATAFRKWEAGQISDEQFRLAVRAEIERRQDRRLLKGARVRGAEWLRERLIRARRMGELSAEQVNLALWLIDQAPQVATDLGISIKDGDNEIANGTYNVFARIVTIFASNANANTATHEILHHTERMMPAAVQAGIRAEWLRQLRQQVAAAREKADAGQRVMLDWMLEAAEAGQDQLALSIWKGLGGKGLSGLVDYQYAAASEYWAVNAARILRERHEATSWIERARQWLRELIAKVRALFDLPSDAAVIRGLEAVMQGDGSFVSPSMISRLGPSVAAFEDRTAARPDPETGMPQRTWQGYVERARRLIDAIDKKLDPLSSLPGYRDYLKRRYEALGEIAVSNELAENIRKAFLKATEADKHAVYDYLTTAGATTKAIGDAALRAEAERIKTRIAKIGDQLVARGLLDPDAREQYRDRYLPRLYLKHLLSEQDYRAIGTGKKLSDMGYLKQRKDIPEDVRRVLLGEIKDPGFLSAMAVSRPLRDMALIDFLAFIAERGGAQRWALTPQLVEWRGRRVTPEWLMSEAKWLRKRADYPTKEDAAAARALAAEMEQQAAEGLRALDDVADLDRYRAMPDSPRYGYLRGLLVRKEIYEDLVGVHQVRPEDLTFFENVFGYGGIGTKITQAFKTAKVALNPPAQIRNWISNMVLLQLSGVALHRLPRRLYQAIRDMRTNGTYWRIAKKYGVSEATFTANELMRLEEETLRFLKESGDISPLRRMMVLAQLFSAPVINKASDIYQAAEAWFKTAKIIDAMESDGLSEADAALEAQKWLFDYSLVPQEVRYARNAPIGAPFLTFWYKVAPRMLEVSLLHPQRLIPWVALMASLPMLAAQALDADDDEMRRFYAALPEWMRAKPHLTVLPWRDDAGRVQVMDLGYFFPWTLFTETIYNVYRGDAKAALGAPGQMVLSGPIPQLLTAIGTGVDPFTDREIAKKGDPPAQQTVAWLNFLYNMAAPPIITSNGLLSPMGLADSQYAGKLYSGLAGTTNRYGDERTTTGQAIASAMGLLSYGIDPETSRAKQLRQMAREIKDAEFRLRARMVDRGLTDEQRKRIVEEYREEMVRLSEKARQFARETGPVPTPLKRAKAAQ